MTTWIWGVLVGLGCAEAILYALLCREQRAIHRDALELEARWTRHERAVQRDVSYLQQWQDFLRSYATVPPEDEII